MFKKLYFTLSCVVMLSGCIKLLPDKPDSSIQRVDLTAAPVTTKAVFHKDASIKVYLPAAPDMLNSIRIAISQYDQDLKLMNYLADVEWKDNLLTLVQQRFMEALKAINVFTSVSLDSEKFRSKYHVYSYIHKFEIDQKDGQNKALIGITFTLCESQANRIIVQKMLNVQQDINVNTTMGFMVALDKAFTAMQQQLIQMIENSSILTEPLEPFIKARPIVDQTENYLRSLMSQQL